MYIDVYKAASQKMIKGSIKCSENTEKSCLSQIRQFERYTFLNYHLGQVLYISWVVWLVVQLFIYIFILCFGALSLVSGDLELGL